MDGRKALIGESDSEGASARYRNRWRQTMMDEIWMRSWNADHARFSADLDRGFAQLGAALKPLFARRPRGGVKAAPARPAS